MRTFTKTATALGLMAAILAGPAAEEARAEPVSAVLIGGAAIVGAYGGKVIGTSVGVAALGTAFNGAWIGAGLGAYIGAVSMHSLLAQLSALGPGAVVTATPVLLTPAGMIVAGATVTIAAAVIVYKWDAIEPKLEQAVDWTAAMMRDAGGWTADAARELVWWTANGTRLIAADIAEAAAGAGRWTAATGGATWDGTKAAAVWTADITMAGAEATWDGTKAAAVWTADITAAGASAAWDGTKAATGWTAWAAGTAWSSTFRWIGEKSLALAGDDLTPTAGAILPVARFEMDGQGALLVAR